MDDDVIRGATVTHEGKITFPPPTAKDRGDCGEPRRRQNRGADPEQKRAEEIAAFKTQTRNQVSLLAIGGG